MIPIYLLDAGASFRVEYLIIAGGGGGYGNAYPGAGSGGGGGAGGYLSSVTGEQSGGPSSILDKIVLYSGSTFTLTVGAGGSSNGSNSVFGSLTAIGGGYGRNDIGNGISGGSGGGSGGYSGYSGGSGTTNQGNNGGTGYESYNFPQTMAAGGGGGAGQAGNVNGQSYGGNGLASSITGTSVYRAGGGGGTYTPYDTTPQPGGLGGGGGGRRGDLRNPPAANPTSGTANTGGGGGGGGANGGSGIVIVRYPSIAREMRNISAGLTYSFVDTGTYKIYQFTAGTGTVTF